MMADDIAIRVENLSKRYRIGGIEERNDTLVGMLSHWLKQPGYNLRRLRNLTRFGENGQNSEDIIWALKNVSFEVKRGEALGIIGRNGAGKSTLLKILSRITYPTGGKIKLSGRVSSLLEVGTGFHPELTGRENIYLNGTILGMRKAEIDRKFDEIVDFSGVETFIDTPVKRYSSGMRVRLAFSIAAHLEPEILLVDEVLAVGDIGFQRKSLGKMENVSTSGRTVLFVSHNLAMIETLCSRAILLEEGQKKLEDSTPAVVAAYMQLSRDPRITNLRKRSDRSGTGEIRFTAVSFLDGRGNQLDQVHSGQDCILCLNYELTGSKVPPRVTFGASFFSRGAHLFSVSNQFTRQAYDDLPPVGRVLCQIPRLPLVAGIYRINIICRVGGAIADWIRDATDLVVSEGDFFGTGWPSIDSHQGVLVDHSWQIQNL